MEMVDKLVCKGLLLFTTEFGNNFIYLYIRNVIITKSRCIEKRPIYNVSVDAKNKIEITRIRQKQGR